MELFYSGVSVDLFQTQLRSYGAELRQRLPAVAALGTPEVDVVTGFARARDEPVHGKLAVLRELRASALALFEQGVGWVV